MATGVGDLLQAAAARQAAGDLEAAAALYARLLKAQPRHWVALRNFGSLRRAQGRPGDAVELYRRALRLAPDQPSLHRNLSNALVDLGRIEPAIEHLQRALAASPEDVAAIGRLANLLGRAERLEDSLACYRRGIALAPESIPLWQGLALTLHRLERFDEARQAYARLLELAPAEESARFLLAAVEGGRPATAPPAHIRGLFDAFAPWFERNLVGELGYRVPEQLEALLRRHLPAEACLDRAVDLGCGTGLLGERLRPLCRHLEGVDLSPGMLAQADRKRVYDRLVEDDAVAFLRAEGPAWSLIAAADLLIYVGELAPLIAAAAARLEPAGLLLVSTESQDIAADSWGLGPAARFRHGRDHVAAALTRAGLALVGEEEEPIRREGDVATLGGLFLARSG